MSILRFPLQNTERQRGTVTFYLIDNEGDRIPGEETSVVLYLPNTIVLDGGVNYNNNAQLGLLGAEAESAVRAGGDAGATGTALQRTQDAINSATSSITDGIQGLLSGEDTAGGLTKVLQASGFYNTEVGAGIRSGLGRTPHPHLRALFEGVNIRQFSFQFDMVPNSPDEARRIKEIVKFFRTKMYPTTQSDLAYVHPEKFQIKYQYHGEDGNREIAHKIKPAFLQSAKVTFNPNGEQAFHADGEFLSTRIELTFVEERALERDDVINGF